MAIPVIWDDDNRHFVLHFVCISSFLSTILVNQTHTYHTFVYSYRFATQLQPSETRYSECKDDSDTSKPDDKRGCCNQFASESMQRLAFRNTCCITSGLYSDYFVIHGHCGLMISWIHHIGFVIGLVLRTWTCDIRLCVIFGLVM
jgi:hypothetical protein